MNPLFTVFLPGITLQCGLKNPGKKLQTLQDKERMSLMEINIRRGISIVMEDRSKQSDENKKILSIDADNLYCWAMSQSLLYEEIKLDKNVKLEDIFNPEDDSDIVSFLEC